MPTLDFTTGADFPDRRKETAKAKEQRLAREAEMIDAARDSVAVGRTASLEVVTAWVDSWNTDNELPPPHFAA